MAYAEEVQHDVTEYFIFADSAITSHSFSMEKLEPAFLRVGSALDSRLVLKSGVYPSLARATTSFAFAFISA